MKQAPAHRTWYIYVIYDIKHKQIMALHICPRYYESNWENAWFLPVDQIISGLHHSFQIDQNFLRLKCLHADSLVRLSHQSNYKPIIWMHAKLKSFKQFTELAWADVFKLQAYHSTTSPSGQFPCRILFSRCVSQKSCACSLSSSYSLSFSWGRRD